MKINFPKIDEDTISMILGLIVVIAAASLIFQYFRNRSGKVDVPGVTDKSTLEENQEIKLPDEGNSVTPGVTENKNVVGQEYTVKMGDHLWKIAQDVYGSGYNWVDIARENKLANPGQLAVGQKLKLPVVEKKEATIADGKGEVNTIEGNEYTVVKGDSLSKIALRAYGDMYAWPKLYEANKGIINSPNVIKPGWKLNIPR